MNDKPRLAVIGAGNVGLSLAVLAQRSGQFTVCVGARSASKAQQLVVQHDRRIPITTMQAAVTGADIVVLAVTDKAIASVCEQLSKHFAAGATVAHCSGALTSEELQGVGLAADINIASLHPLQTFPSVEAGIERLAGTYCYYEGNEGAAAMVQAFCDAIGMQSVPIEKSAKALYHAAAVMACNYLSVLTDASLALGEAAGIDRDTLWKSLEPMVTATVNNIGEVGPVKALTGPIARGDADTVQTHLHALTAMGDGAESVSQIYAAMGLRAASMAQERGSISKDAAHDISKLLT